MDATTVWSLIGLAFTLLVSYWFYRLQKKAGVSEQQRRVLRNEIVSIVESYIINKESEVISNDLISNLIEAVERENSVVLNITSRTILQDVSLRLQRSTHLDVTQKAEYVNVIRGIIDTLTTTEDDVDFGSEFRNAIINYVEAVKSGDEKEQESNRQILVKISKRLVKASKSIAMAQRYYIAIQALMLYAGLQFGYMIAQLLVNTKYHTWVQPMLLLATFIVMVTYNFGAILKKLRRKSH